MRVIKYLPPKDDPRDEGSPPILSAILFADGQLLLGAAPHALFAWDVKTRECVYQEELVKGYPSDELLFPLTAGPGQTFACPCGQDFALWSLTEWKPLRVFAGHLYHVYQVVFPDDRHALSCSGDSILRRWNIASGECLQEESVFVPRRMADSVRTERIAIAGTHGIELIARDTLRHMALHEFPFEATSYNAATPFHQLRTGAQALAWCPDHQHLLIACGDFIVRQIDAASGRVIGKWPGHTGAINDVAILPGGRGFVSIGDDHSVRFWSMNSSECIGSIYLGGRALGLCVSPQGQVYVGCYDGFVYAMEPPEVLIP